MTRRHLRDRFFREFQITKDERDKLFDAHLPKEPKDWLAAGPVSREALLSLIDHRPGSRPEEGACCAIFVRNTLAQPSTCGMILLNA